MITVNINPFWSIFQTDYHGFKAAKDAYQLAGLRVNYEEVGCDGIYEAVFWIGEKPVDYINKLKRRYDDTKPFDFL